MSESANVNCTLTLVDFDSRNVILVSVSLADIKTLLKRGLGTWVEPPAALMTLSDKIDNLPSSPQL